MTDKQMTERVERILSYEATKTIWRHRYDSIEFKESSAMNEELFGMALNKRRNCSCIEDFFLLLRHKYKQKTIINMETKKFVLKQGKALQSHHLAEPLTRSSSDEDAMKLLKLHPNLIKHFEKYPGDWEKQLKEFDPKKVTKVVDISAGKGSAKADAPAAPVYGKTGTEMKAYAAKNKIDLGGARSNADIEAAIKSHLAKADAPADELTDEQKAAARFNVREKQLVELGFALPTAEGEPFTRGEEVIAFEDVFESTDDEFTKLLPSA